MWLYEALTWLSEAWFSFADLNLLYLYSKIVQTLLIKDFFDG